MGYHTESRIGNVHSRRALRCKCGRHKKIGIAPPNGAVHTAGDGVMLRNLEGATNNTFTKVAATHQTSTCVFGVVYYVYLIRLVAC